jgi:hypothetical protein
MVVVVQLLFNQHLGKAKQGHVLPLPVKSSGMVRLPLRRWQLMQIMVCGPLSGGSPSQRVVHV